jgi:FixJ family two-component response regulator
MPVMGGAECLTRLRTDGVCTPVLIVSGFDPDDMAGTLVERGEALFLRKPYSVSELLQALQTVLV